MMAARTPAPSSRLEQLLGFLAHDPENLQLLGDAASTALDEGDPAAATSLLDRYSAIAALPPALVNLAGLAALGERRFVDAAGHFTSLIEQGDSAPELRLNLAWSKAMAEDLAPALELLDEEVLALGPRAATLKVRLLHRLDRLDEALETGGVLAERYPDDQALMGALANVALDAERADLAGLYAGRAGTHPDGLTTVAMLMLDEDKVEDSMTLFDRILEADAGNPRALLGKGLGALALGDAEAAAAPIDAAAAAFGDHLGSWVAAGWAYYLKGDLAASRARFQTALELDDSFAETHGALAVLDLAEGDPDSARRRKEVALRLDRNCFAAALAETLLLERAGKPDAAAKVRQAALEYPIGPGGRTIARTLAALHSKADKG